MGHRRGLGIWQGASAAPRHCQGSRLRVNARWTAFGRRSACKPGKADRLDARAIALLVRQAASTLPRVLPEDHTALLDPLSTEREGALAEATRLRNQFHALLFHLDPEYQPRVRILKSPATLAVLEKYVAPGGGPLRQARAAAVRQLAERLRLALTQAEELANRIRDSAAADFWPLTRLCGVNLLTAGTLAGVLGPGRRFATDVQVAACAGVAPLEASSTGLVRHRLHRGGNRRLNAILYRIALTQAHHSSEARAYLDRRVAEGKTRREAMRALKRFIIRAIWRLWQECRPTSNTTFAENAA